MAFVKILCKAFSRYVNNHCVVISLLCFLQSVYETFKSKSGFSIKDKQGLASADEMLTHFIIKSFSSVTKREFFKVMNSKVSASKWNIYSIYLYSHKRRGCKGFIKKRFHLVVFLNS